MSRYEILLLGRPNVGKSSLFNALLGGRRSIVLDEAGTTLDAVKEKPNWAQKDLALVDHQGILGENDTRVLSTMLGESDAFLMVVDGVAGLNPMDLWLAREAKKEKKPLLLVINKTENIRSEEAIAEFAELGIETFVSVSASHRQNLEEIRQWCEANAPELTTKQASRLTLSLVGRPNAGKSTLMNLLCNRYVSRVSPTAHTTRDPVGYELHVGDTLFCLLDTAGIRRRQDPKNFVEKFSIQAAKRMIRQSDVVFLLLNCSEPLSEQDKRLMSLLEAEGKPTLILLNFWDLLDEPAKKEFEKETSDYGLFRHYPSQPISAKEGWNTDTLLRQAEKLSQKSQRRIPTSQLNNLVKELIAKNPPPASGKGNFNVLYSSQVQTKPPTFVFFMNRKESLPGSYESYLRNELRKRLGFKGQPIRLFFRGAEKKPRKFHHRPTEKH